MASKSAPQAALRCLRAAAPLRAQSSPRIATRCLHQRATALTTSQSSRRPRIQHWSRVAAPSLPSSPRRTIFIQTEPTPNADALKYNPNAPVLPATISAPFLEYLDPRSTLSPPHPSPLAAKLLAVDGVSSVFLAADYITVTKESGTPWPHINPEVFALISEFITSGQPVVTTAQGRDGNAAPEEEDSLAYNENDSEVVGMIKELLETRIRPAIREDGGDIDFRGFDDASGTVNLKLRGACRTCDSSTVTLKNGIESMLMHYIEEVKGVVQVLDEEELVAQREFERFEERLRAGKGSST